MKYVRRTLYVILAVVVLFVAYVFTISNGSTLALNMAYLRCTTLETGWDFASTKDERSFHLQRPTIIGRLQKDWVNNKVLLNWVAAAGEEEDGLSPTRSLSIKVDKYSGWNYEDKVQRNLDRATLIYTWENKDSMSSDVIVWKTRQCELIDKTTFEAQRKKSADATTAQQKI
tara:strand:- start:250 stop:765 length:516 start_codon:yes stop_codon:yes gene_type:complete